MGERQRPIRARSTTRASRRGGQKDKHALAAHRPKRPARLRSPQQKPLSQVTRYYAAWPGIPAVRIFMPRRGAVMLEPRDCCLPPRTRKCTASCTTLPSTGPGFPVKSAESPGGCSSLATVGESTGARPLRKRVRGRKPFCFEPIVCNDRASSRRFQTVGRAAKGPSRESADERCSDSSNSSVSCGSTDR